MELHNQNKFRKLTVIEDLGYGLFKTDSGIFTVDFAADGINQILISDTGTFTIVGDERNENDQVTIFYFQ